MCEVVVTQSQGGMDIHEGLLVGVEDHHPENLGCRN